jgi:hypothetical protein
VSGNYGLLLAALVPLLVIEIGTTAYCLIDIRKHPHTRRLSRRAWIQICIWGGSIGGVAYLLAGRDQDR